MWRVRSHPGLALQEELAARGLSANRLALALGVNANRITEILHGQRAVTPDTAVRLAAYLGGEPRFWLVMQALHDLSVFELDKGEEVRRQVRPEEG